MKVMAIIPARSASKGIPRKNVMFLAGKPLLAHSIVHAKASPSATRVVVSTDDAEIADVARALKSITECEKLNVAALGNQVAQLHVHVIARRHCDKAWPKPVWGAAAPTAYDPVARDGLIGALRRALQIERLSS